MYAEERQRAIAELVSQRGRMSVIELARQFDVTTETVRRDLSHLERLNLLRRVHGGALPADSLTVLEIGLGDRDAASIEEKRQIAEAAIQFLPGADSTLLMDAGSTTVRMADVLPRDRRLKIITHAVPVAARLAELPNVEVHLLPGRVRRNTQAAVGVETVAALDRIRADIAFMGTNAISLEHGLSTPDHAEAATKAAMIRSAQRVVLLADASKIGSERTVRFAELSDIDVLVTDSLITDDQRRSLERAGMEVVVA